MAEAALVGAIEKEGLPYKRVEGEAVFYGPKIDIKVRDALNRPWQITTIQFDFWLPEAFEIEYIGEDGQPHQPYMVHRALLGSMERFIGVLTEHYKGAFPAWLAPVQAKLIPIADRHHDYAYQVARQLESVGIRAEVDDSNDRMANKIRKTQENDKPPYILVMGDREAEAGAVALRMRSGDDRGAMPVDEFIDYALGVINGRAYE
jgi:threonyl-tRNA synthetase